jgi:GTPase SAR1 family protein
MTDIANNLDVQQFNEWLQRRKKLASLIQRQMGVLETLEMTAWRDNLRQLEERVLSDNFKVLIMGEFKRGKSTFINAMLGQKVLPAYATPCTAVINEVKWGEPPRAMLHYLKQDGSPPKTLEVDYRQLEQYVTIHEGQDRTSYVNPYEKAELYWPLDICRNGIEIIDSPGLNEDPERQKITLTYLRTADATIFVISCDAPISLSERSAIDTIREAGHKNIFFICNRINMIEPEERKRLIDYCLSELSPLTEQGARYIFFINALGALNGRLASDLRRLQESNMLQVEQKLKTFLATERGRLKILRPTAELKASIKEARRTIPARERLLRTDLETIQDRYEKVKGELDEFELERQQIVRRLTNFRTDTRNYVTEVASGFYSKLADQIEGWVKEYEIKQPMGLLQVLSKDAQKRVVAEVTKFLTDKVASETKAWQNSTLLPELTRRFDALTKELEERTRKFVNHLDAVRFELVTGSPISISPDAVQQQKVSALERILAAATGFVLIDLGSAAIGATFGFNEMLKSIIPQLAIVATTVILFGWNPLVLIPAMLLGGGIQGWFKANSANKKIRDGVGQVFEQKLRETRSDQAKEMADTVDKKLKEVENALNEGLGLEIQSIRDQVNSVIAEKQRGQARVTEAIHRLAAISDDLNAIDSEIDELINEVALPKADV